MMIFQLVFLCLLLHPFNGFFSRTTWVSQYQNGKTSLDLDEARDDGVLGCSGTIWTICKQFAPRCRQPHRSIFTGQMLFQCQSTEGRRHKTSAYILLSISFCFVPVYSICSPQCYFLCTSLTLSEQQQTELPVHPVPCSSYYFCECCSRCRLQPYDCIIICFVE